MTYLGLDYSKITGEFVEISEGDYDLKIVSEDIKATKEGDKYLKIVFQITAGIYQGGLTSAAFFIFNSDLERKARAEAKLKRLGLACGIYDELKDSAELVGHSIRGKAKKQHNEYVGFVHFYPAHAISTDTPAGLPPSSSPIRSHADLDDDIPF